MNLHLIGYRNDIADLYKSADVCAFPSIREGLGMAALEGMVCGLPLIYSDNRGSKSYATEKNSIMCHTNNPEEFAKAITALINAPKLDSQMGENGRRFAKQYSCISVNRMIKDIYKKLN